MDELRHRLSGFQILGQLKWPQNDIHIYVGIYPTYLKCFFLDVIGNATIKEANLLCKTCLPKTDNKELVGVRGKQNTLHANTLVILGQKAL